MKAALRNCDGAFFCWRCGMDESGIEVVDLVTKVSYDDCMMNDRRDDQAINGVRRQLARQELRTNPDLIELAEKMAERVRVMLFGDDEEVLDKIEDLACDEFAAEMEQYDGDAAMEVKYHDEAIEIVTQVLFEKVKPLIHRVIETGDWNPNRG